MTPIELALKTWYKPDNPKYLDPLHPTIKLAGEIGELLDLYAKHLFKPEFDWMDCKWCNKPKEKEHYQNQSNKTKCWEYKGTKNYTPKVIDELGDWTWYKRILEFLRDEKLTWTEPDKITALLVEINLLCAQVAYDLVFGSQIDYGRLDKASSLFETLITEIGYDYSEIIEANYQKLNSEPTNHGWASAN